MFYQRAISKLSTQAAVMNGCLDSKSVREYTKTHDIRVKLGGEKQHEALPINEDTTFGKGVRPSTPFEDILGHNYRFDWVMASDSATEVQEQRKPSRPKPTKASQSIGTGDASKTAPQRGFPDAPTSDGLWKMKKFQNVQSKVASQM